jgi:glycosyltransferase involved in cell wall biosynthesis
MSDKKISIRLIPHVPFSIHQGGFELSAANLERELKKNCDIKYLNFQKQNIDFQILHLFGGSSNWYDIAYHFPKDKKLVLTALAAANFKKGLNFYIKNKFIQILNKFTINRTVHDRVSFLLHKADGIICLNSLEKYFFIHRYNLSPDKLTIIPNGIKNIFFSKPNYSFSRKFNVSEYVLFVGTITHRKNPLLLANACSRLGLKSVFIGNLSEIEVTYTRNFLNFVNNQKNNAYWLSNLHSGDILLKSAYDCCKVFCLPSSSETQPLSAMEALAARKKVILADLPYAHEKPFLDNVIHCKINLASLESALLQAFRDSSSRKLTSDYSIKSIAKSHKNFYLKIIKKS